MKQYFPALDPPKNRPQPVYFYRPSWLQKYWKILNFHPSNIFGNKANFWKFYFYWKTRVSLI